MHRNYIPWYKKGRTAKAPSDNIQPEPVKDRDADIEAAIAAFAKTISLLTGIPVHIETIPAEEEGPPAEFWEDDYDEDQPWEDDWEQPGKNHMEDDEEG
jgi:hypothetical protein